LIQVGLVFHQQKPTGGWRVDDGESDAGGPAAVGAISFEVITDWSELVRLEDEWNELWCSARYPFVLQTFTAADILRRIPLHRRAVRPWCVIGRVQEKLVLIWPFMIYRNHGWALAAPWTSEVDCSDPLVIDGGSHFAHARKAWNFVLTECPCDLFQFQFVRRYMPLHELVSGEPWRVLIYDLELPLVEFSGSWEQYEEQLSRKQHSGFARKRRRLLDLGGVQFVCLRPDTSGLAEWLVEHKKKWLAKTGWPDKIQLTRPLYVDFLRAVLIELGSQHRCRVFAIKRYEKLVAVDVTFVDRRTLQWFVGTFDEEYGKYSPGQLLKEFVIHWAFDNGLIYDMLGGAGQHKNYLATKLELVSTWRIGRTWWGRFYVFLRRWLGRAGMLK
jgi:CelD/BcsL family acetyltransferase involved in cellulose biosynthesis